MRFVFSLFSHGAGNFLRSDILHVFATAIEVDAGFVAIALGDDLHLEAAFLTTVHITRGGTLLIGVTHVLVL